MVPVGAKLVENGSDGQYVMSISVLMEARYVDGVAFFLKDIINGKEKKNRKFFLIFKIIFFSSVYFVMCASF